MDIIYEIRRRHSVQKQTITAIAREMGISRPTVRKHLNTVEEPKYERVQPASGGNSEQHVIELVFEIWPLSSWRVCHNGLDSIFSQNTNDPDYVELIYFPAVK